MRSDNRRRLVVVGAGDFQLPLVQHAAKNCEVLLVAPEVSCDFLPFVNEVLIADVRDMHRALLFAQGAECEAREVRNGKISRKICGRRKPASGIVTDQTDIAVETVAYVAEKMGLPGTGYATSRLFTDKALMRRRLSELGIKQLPNATVTSLKEALAYYEILGGEVIIKPTNSQGSRGVFACRNREELAQKYPETEKWSSTGSMHEVIVERRASGREFVVEGIAVGGEFVNLCIGDTEYFGLEDAFAAKTRVFPTVAEDGLRSRVLDINSAIIRGFGLTQGITHSEFIMEGDEVYLIETAARGGGVFISSDLISLSCGLETEEALVGLALGDITSLGRLPGLDAESLRTNPALIAARPQCWCGYISCFVPRGFVESVSGVDEVTAMPFVHRNQLRQLARLQGSEQRYDHIDKTSRYAVIASAQSEHDLIERFELIKRTLKVRVRSGDGELMGLIWD